MGFFKKLRDFFSRLRTISKCEDTDFFSSNEGENPSSSNKGENPSSSNKGENPSSSNNKGKNPSSSDKVMDSSSSNEVTDSSSSNEVTDSSSSNEVTDDRAKQTDGEWQALIDKMQRLCNKLQEPTQNQIQAIPQKNEGSRNIIDMSYGPIEDFPEEELIEGNQEDNRTRYAKNELSKAINDFRNLKKQDRNGEKGKELKRKIKSLEMVCDVIIRISILQKLEPVNETEPLENQITEEDYAEKIDKLKKLKKWIRYLRQERDNTPVKSLKKYLTTVANKESAKFNRRLKKFAKSVGKKTISSDWEKAIKLTKIINPRYKGL